MDRWTPQEANAWWDARPWVCGFNFLPSTAVNFLEMWHVDTFDKATITRELGWAANLGFNSFRINLHYLVWKHDRDGLIDRLDWIMGMADGLGLTTVPCLFDDCGFGGFEPTYGPQPDPVPGVHNSRAVASPGRALLLEQAEWDGFQAYTRDILKTFRKDRRILFWDLYNEPGNRMVFGMSGFRIYEPDMTAASLALLRLSFEWARAEAPSQPITVAAWTTPEPGSSDDPYQTEVDRIALDGSDIITFHAYWDATHVARFINYLRTHNRPLLCTEWMARAIDSRITDQLALFHREKVGCFQWGLVKGRTQTHHPWPAELVAAHGGHPDRSIWFHDILDSDGSAYDEAEARVLREYAVKASAG